MYSNNQRASISLMATSSNMSSNIKTFIEGEKKRLENIKLMK